ncbi:MAG TPA: 16S rRNA (cytosine(1402)-N(4))-methyltransferase [Stellaceae bacterium]|nr:16S rRNA (cytosine(1402)-N(4))-methyltransferase [Stellaceae bacterium]
MRIEVNHELDQVREALPLLLQLLAPQGRLAVISFHSLEDRSVKTFLRARAADGPRASRHLPAAQLREPSFRLTARKPIGPSAAEIAANPRARSARLRVAERTAAPAWENAA